MLLAGLSCITAPPVAAPSIWTAPALEIAQQNVVKKGTGTVIFVPFVHADGRKLFVGCPSTDPRVLLAGQAATETFDYSEKNPGLKSIPGAHSMKAVGNPNGPGHILSQGCASVFPAEGHVGHVVWDGIAFSSTL